MKNVSLRAAILFATAFASPALAQQVAPYQSLASAAYADLTFGTAHLPVANIGGVSGQASSSDYDTVTAIGTLSQVFYLPGTGMPGFGLQLTNTRAEASGTPEQSSSGNVSMDGATLSLVPTAKSGSTAPIFYVTIGRN
jgi:hypothetical protein